MPAPDRKRRLTAFLVAMAVLIATPLAVVAADAFTDVPNTNVFHDDIAWLADAGVTKGCNPPDNTEFCPSDNVTREQMAAFMRRLAENKVVDAATAETADHATTADSATSAGDANTLNGKGGNAYATVFAATSGSFNQGNKLGVVNAGAAFEADSLTIEAPEAGTLILNATSSWEDGNGWVVQWLEVNQETACDSFTDGDAVPGSETEEGPDFTGASVVSMGAVNAPAGTSTVSLCIWMFSGSSDSIAHTLSAQWTAGTNVSLSNGGDGIQKGTEGTPSGS